MPNSREQVNRASQCSGIDNLRTLADVGEKPEASRADFMGAGHTPRGKEARIRPVKSSGMMSVSD